MAKTRAEASFVRREALVMSVQSFMHAYPAEVQSPEHTDAIIQRARHFEQYVKNGAYEPRKAAGGK